MTDSEALALADDLQSLKSLRENRFFARHFLPHIARLRDEHRVGMRDTAKTAAERCEHQTAWEDMQSLVDFTDDEEKRLRQTLREHDQQSHTIDRPFSHDP